MNQKTDQTDTAISEERRNLLIGAGMLGAGALAAATAASPAFAGDHKHHHDSSNSHAALIASLHACVSTSEACIDHCMTSFKSGDTTLAKCAEIVLETMAFCAAHAKLASYNSANLKAMSELGIKICADCEKECRKHEKHASCKACADACVACIKECKAFLKA